MKGKQRFFKKMTPRAQEFLSKVGDKEVSRKVNVIADSLFPQLPGEEDEVFEYRKQFQEWIEKKLWSKGTTRFSVRLGKKYRLTLEWKETAEDPSQGASSRYPTIIPSFPKIATPPTERPKKMRKLKKLDPLSKEVSKPRLLCGRYLELDIVASDKQNKF